MKGKFFATVSLAAVFALGASTASCLALQQQRDNQQQPEKKTQSVNGTIKAIGSDHRSFTIEVSEGSAKGSSMDFVLDEKSQVQGKVVTGTLVAITYQPSNDGKNVVLTIAAQS
jgi:hypothetical protein